MGYEEYWECRTCGQLFSDATGTTQTTIDAVTIPATGHDTTPVHHEAKDPTCTETGNFEYWECASCGKFFSDEGCTIEKEEADLTIPASHNVVLRAKVEPTYEAEGRRKHYECTVCHTLFEYDEATGRAGNETTADQLVIPKLEKVTTNITIQTINVSTSGTVNVIGAGYTLSKTADGTTYYYTAGGWVEAADNIPDNATLYSDVNGTLVFSDLEDGTYTLKEVSTPMEYTHLLEAVEIKIENQNITQISDLHAVSLGADNTITILNSKSGGELPETGGPGEFVYIMAGATLVGCSALCLLYKRKRERRILRTLS